MSMHKPAFVAEVSSNHACELERCLRFVEVAAQIGCSAVKFQQFKIRQLFAPEALRANPALLEREAWELPESFNAELSAYAHGLGIKYASTPFYRDAVELLGEHVDFFKLASYQLPWLDLLKQVARIGKPVVLSVGMATLSEIDSAVEALQTSGCRDLTLLHCVSNYPTKPEHANLAALNTLRARYGLPIGWSDHTVAPAVVQRASEHFDAAMIEFHLDLDRTGAEFASGHCWLPETIEPLIRGEWDARAQPKQSVLDGDGQVGPRPSEAHERQWRSDPSDGLRPCLAERSLLLP